VYVAGDSGFCNNEQKTEGLHALGKLEPEHLAKRMSRAAIYCLPARYEPFGLSILEAALSGCALVVGDIGSLREVWRDSALYVTPGNSAELEWTLKQLIYNPELREKMADAAQRRAQYFTADRMAQTYLSLYDELIMMNNSAYYAAGRSAN
jgi:glycogen synthase